MILLHPLAQTLTEGARNPKTPPPGWWEAFLGALGRTDIIQIGVAGQYGFVPDFRLSNPLWGIARLVSECDYWIAIDSFLPHLAHHQQKPGVVIWSQSDPLIFGYPENLNLLKDRSYLRPYQFQLWTQCPYNAEAFLDPQDAARQIVAWRTEVERKVA